MSGSMIGIGVTPAVSGKPPGGATRDTAALIASINAVAGAGAVRALYVPGIETYKDSGLEAAPGNGERIYQINDLTGNGYHLRESGAGKGPTYYAAAGINGQPTMSFDGAVNLDKLVCVIDADAGTANMIEVDQHSQFMLGNLPNNGVDQSTAYNNPGITSLGGGSNRPYMVWRAAAPFYTLMGADGDGGAAATLNTAYGADAVHSLRHKSTTLSGSGYGVGFNKTYSSRVSAGDNASLALKMQMGQAGLYWLIGTVDVYVVLGVDVDDTKAAQIEDVLTAFSAAA